ncbi:MAG: hypothetical protein ABIY70_24790 [Capsulimonas sp.]|uniref:hypothetical protein n=1 Tax=Capsulimonas sp. TaxID=2494211 RepID=UPI003263CE4A
MQSVDLSPIEPEIDYGLQEISGGVFIHVLDRHEKTHVPLRFSSPLEARGYAHYLHGGDAWREFLDVVPIPFDNEVETPGHSVR